MNETPTKKKLWTGRRGRKKQESSPPPRLQNRGLRQGGFQPQTSFLCPIRPPNLLCERCNLPLPPLQCHPTEPSVILPHLQGRAQFQPAIRWKKSGTHKMRPSWKKPDEKWHRWSPEKNRDALSNLGPAEGNRRPREIIIPAPSTVMISPVLRKPKWILLTSGCLYLLRIFAVR